MIRTKPTGRSTPSRHGNAKVFHADPLTWRKCGGKLEIVAYLHDAVAIKQVLDHLGLGLAVALGVGVAWAGMQLLQAQGASYSPRTQEIRFDAPMIWLMAGLATRAR